MDITQSNRTYPVSNRFLLYTRIHLLIGNVLHTPRTGEDRVLPVLTEVTHHKDVGKVKVQRHTFLNLALDAGELFNKAKLTNRH